MTLASFCEVREAHTAVRFEITRESAVRGFNLGLRAEAMLAHLEKLSGKGLDQNLRWNLTDWEERYSAVSVIQGTVITLAEDRRYLAETVPLSRLIRSTLAPGVYLLPLEAKDEALESLRRAGVDIIARLSLSFPAEDPLFRAPYPPLNAESLREQLFPAEAPPAVSATEEQSLRPEIAEERKENFRQALKKLRLTKQDMDELAARIERRLIVSESQLAGGAVRYEKLEARNLDFAGKTVVAKQAIANGSLVEAVFSGEGGENRILGFPQALEKSGGESVLVIRPAEGSGVPPAGVPPDIRLPLGKISLLRRIKQSIFGE
jgi:hypothetical protein